MSKVLRTDEIDFAEHGQVFNGQKRHFALSEFVHTRAFGENGNPKVSTHKIFDRCDVVDLENNIEVLDPEISADQRRDKKPRRTGIRQTKNQAFPHQLRNRNLISAGKRMFRRDSEHQTVGIHKKAVEECIADLSFRNGKIYLVVAKHVAKILYGIRAKLQIDAVMPGRISRERLRNRIAFCSMRNPDFQLRNPPLFIFNFCLVHKHRT